MTPRLVPMGTWTGRGALIGSVDGCVDDQEAARTVVRHLVRHAAEHEAARAAHATVTHDDHVGCDVLRNSNERVGGFARDRMHLAGQLLTSRFGRRVLAHLLGLRGDTSIHALDVDGRRACARRQRHSAQRQRPVRAHDMQRRPCQRCELGGVPNGDTRGDSERSVPTTITSNMGRVFYPNALAATRGLGRAGPSAAHSWLEPGYGVTFGGFPAPGFGCDGSGPGVGLGAVNVMTPGSSASTSMSYDEFAPLRVWNR